MAKIEIYETEQDVAREGLQQKLRRGNMLTDLGIFFGTFAGMTGAFHLLFDKTGISQKIHDFVSKDGKALQSSEKIAADNKLWRTGYFSVSGAFLLLATTIGLLNHKTKKQLAALGPADTEQVIMPDQINRNALSEFPIRGTEVGAPPAQKLHKVPAAVIKTHTQRLMESIAADPVPNR